MMKNAAFSLALCLSTLGLSACGFQPVYSPALSSEAGPIQIGQIDGRAGHELRKALLAETAAGLPGAPAGATMVVSLKETVINTGFRSDGSTFRATLRLTADYVVDLGDDAKSGREMAQVSVNLPDPVLEDITNQTEARQQAAKLLARKIVDTLILEMSPET
ncbi:MAG: hypothetical protein AAFY10_02770 [Pseudomonadota bacterium]